MKPNQSELGTIMNKIKGFKADNLAGLDPANKARWVQEGDNISQK